ncbi:MAG: hypothetical protein FWG99_00320 [Treponema sp.]|nr:hypothetical protein [Treponema sp.]
MSGGGKSGNNRRNRSHYFGKRDDSQASRQDSSRNRDKRNSRKPEENLLADGRLEKNRMSMHERSVWTAPKVPDGPMPAPDCSWCGRPIKDISTAISDKTSGLPVHFDCVLARLNETEALGSQEAICYIGGGRFGVVQHNGLQDADDHITNGRRSLPAEAADFKIKKIFEWENKENHSEWRRSICERFSVT